MLTGISDWHFIWFHSVKKKEQEMIVFGKKSKVVQGHHVQGAECQDCGNGQFSSFGLLKYFHIFWIPFIPTSREVGMQCAHCKKTLVGKELPEPLRRDIKNAVFGANKQLAVPD